VSPNAQQTVTVDGAQQQLIAWDMSKSGLYDNFTGTRPSVCMGQTIFGLTSSNADGSCEIYDINFTTSVDDYLAQQTGIGQLHYQPGRGQGRTYTLGGIQVEQPSAAAHGVYIQNGRKVVK